MKIAFLVGSLAGGGAERVVSEISSEMANCGHDVSVILIASTEQTYSVAPGVNIVDCSKKYKSFGLFHRVKAIRKSLKHLKVDVCISFTVAVNIYAALSCVGLPLKLILAERNDPRYDPTGKFLRMLRKVLYPIADNYVFQTDGEKEFFSKRIQRKSVVIPNPVNPLLPEPYSGKRTDRFVMAGRLAPQKNIKMAIDAFTSFSKIHPEFQLEIYGNGSLKEELSLYIREKSMVDKIILKGATTTLYTDILDAYGFLLSSDYEGISNSMLEAMALGIPTISTDYPSGGAREFINDKENGMLVPVGDSEKMCECMCFLVENADAASSIGKNGYLLRNKLSVDKIVEKWIAYILECVK